MHANNNPSHENSEQFKTQLQTDKRRGPRKRKWFLEEEVVPGRSGLRKKWFQEVEMEPGRSSRFPEALRQTRGNKDTLSMKVNEAGELAENRESFRCILGIVLFCIMPMMKSNVSLKMRVRKHLQCHYISSSYSPHHVMVVITSVHSLLSSV